MAHNTLNGGTVTEIGGGKAMLNGTVYEVGSGKALSGGAVYQVNFSQPCSVRVYAHESVVDGNVLTTSGIYAIGIRITNKGGQRKLNVCYKSSLTNLNDEQMIKNEGWSIYQTDAHIDLMHEAEVGDTLYVKAWVVFDDKVSASPSRFYVNGKEVLNKTNDGSHIQQEYTIGITGNTVVEYDAENRVYDILITMEGR